MPSIHRALRRIRRAIDRGAHAANYNPILQWFVLPVLFMAGLAFVGLAVLTPLPVEMFGPVVVAFAVISYAVIAGFLLVDYALYRLAGMQLLHNRQEHDWDDNQGS